MKANDQLLSSIANVSLFVGGFHEWVNVANKRMQQELSHYACIFSFQVTPVSTI